MNSRLHWLGLNFSGNSLRFAHNADYALLRAALGHQRDDSQISLFWLSHARNIAAIAHPSQMSSQSTRLADLAGLHNYFDPFSYA